MANDNASFYKSYLGYPVIAFLMSINELVYSSEVAALLRDIPWKDLNQKFKNDFNETIEYALKE